MLSRTCERSTERSKLKHAEEWVRDLKDGYQREKKQIEERVSSLEKALKHPRGKSDGGVVTVSDTHVLPIIAESASSDTL